MGKITFILGGARSGKSRFAIELAKKTGKKAAFIATCLFKDSEMEKRISLHKNQRPRGWKTFEEPEDIETILKRNGANFDVIIIDCLTLLVSNLMFKGFSEKEIKNNIRKILSTLTEIRAKSIIISNEVGLGIVPDNKLARDFRDIAGRVNQMVAERSDSVFFMTAGLSLKLK